jgi:glutathione S-transferase
MVRLLAEDIKTKGVLSWKGLHLFHAEFSSCSQKLRIILSLKGVDWESHLVDLLANEHLTPYFMGINPRAVVPVLIDDGDVHIESNDIMLHLERRFPDPRLRPAGMEDRVDAMLREEDALHFDLRTLTFRFMFDPSKPPKSEGDLKRYGTGEAGTVQGKRDGAIAHEAAFWRGYLEHGVNDDGARRSAQAFRRAFEAVDRDLAKREYVLGKEVSLVDVAWLVDVQRLTYAGYPLKTLHPYLDAWRDRLMRRPEISRELRLPRGLDEAVAARQHLLESSTRTLMDICFPELGAVA